MPKQQQIPNSEQDVAERSDAFIKMLAELTTLINGAYNASYTARGQNLLPLAKQLLRFARSIFPAGSAERDACDKLIVAWLRDESLASTPAQRKDRKA